MADCTDPPEYRLFDRAAKKLNTTVLRFYGETVEFAGIGLTVQAVFKRKADTVDGAGARPGVPRDELSIKQTDICEHDIDQGEPVTVRGHAYKIVSVERSNHGMTKLGIRRVH